MCVFVCFSWFFCLFVCLFLTSVVGLHPCSGEKRERPADPRGALEDR